jgi:hypothetical protein
MAYADLADLKVYLKITSNSEDTMLELMLDAATEMIDTVCHRRFAPPQGQGQGQHDETFKFTPLSERSEGNLLDDYTMNLGMDLLSLTSITNGDGTPIPVSGVVLLPSNTTPANMIRIKSSSGYFWTYIESPEESVSVTGRWAFSEHPPKNIEVACLRLAGYLYKQRELGPDSDRAVLSADGVVLAAPKIPGDILTILAPYIRRS